MTRRRKLLLLLVALPLALFVLLVALVFVPAVQTFIVHRALASQPDLKAEVDHVAIGLGGAKLLGLRYEQPGFLLTAPSFEADLTLSDLLGKKVDLTRLAMRDVVIVIDPVAAAAAPASAPKPATPFAGLLDALALPVSLYAEGVDLAGTIQVLGADPVDAEFTLKGGGVAPGAEGAFTLSLKAGAKQGKLVSELLLNPSFAADGRLDAVKLLLNATAETTALAVPARLQTELVVTRAGAGETYRLLITAGTPSTVGAATAPLVELNSSWSPGATQTPGTWRIAVADTDLSPFLLGVALPVFTVKGEGEATASAADRLRLGGQLHVAASSLERLEGVPALGPVSAELSFALETAAGATSVQAFALTLSSAAPVLGVEVRQPFGIDSTTGRIVPSRPGADLLDLTLLGVPVAWVQAFAPAGVTVGGPITGAWTVRAENEGFAATASAPLIVPGLRVADASGPQWSFDAVRIEGSRLRQSPTGWSAALGSVRVQSKGDDLVSVSVEVSQNTGAPLTAKGELRARLAPLTAQPALVASVGRVSAGQAVLSFEATVGDDIAAKTKLLLNGLRAGSAGELPELSANAEFTRKADGVITVKLPLTVRNQTASRSSDAELTATLTPGVADAPARLIARLSSQVLHVPDLQAFTALAPATPPPSTPAPAPVVPAEPATEPLWAGYTGELALALARVVYAPGVELTKIEGTVALTPDTLDLKRLEALLGAGTLNLSGVLNFLRPAGGYGLAASVSGRELVVGPLLSALNPAQPVPLEGTFTLEAKLQGQGSDPASAAGAAAGDIKLNGRDGVLRALNLNTNRFVSTGSTMAGFAGLAGALSGNQQLAKRGAQITALNNVARQFSNLPFQQINLVARRGTDGEIEVGDLNLTAPALTLAGSGALAALPGRGLLDQPLLLRLNLGARGQFARELETLDLLNPLAADAAPDSLRPLTEPLVFDKTLRSVGTDQVIRLLSRALTN